MKTCRKFMLVIMVVLGIIASTASAFAATTVKAGGKKRVNVTVGRTVQLKVKGVKDSKVKWTSSNKKIAIVNPKGKVTVKKPGKATIIAKSGNKKTTFNLFVYKNEWKCSQQDPSKWTYNSPRVCFNALRAYYKGGKLHVVGFWANTEYVDYTKVVARINLYDRNNKNKLIASKDVTYTQYLPARTYNGKVTYVFSGKEVISKNYDLRTLKAYMTSYIF